MHKILKLQNLSSKAADTELVEWSALSYHCGTNGMWSTASNGCFETKGID